MLSMRNRCLRYVVLATIVPVGCGGPTSRPTPPSSEELPILWERHGTASHVARPLRVVVRDAATLARLPITDVPVDFETQMVLVAALGPVPSDRAGVRITRVWRQGDRIHVQVRTLHPAEGGPGAPVRTSPYHVVVVPRSDLNVVGFSATVPQGALAAPSIPGARTPSGR